jgi:hypothetical protein
MLNALSHIDITCVLICQILISERFSVASCNLLNIIIVQTTRGPNNNIYNIESNKW